MMMKTNNGNSPPNSENKFNALLSKLKNNEITADEINDFILTRQDNRYYFINDNTNIRYPALNGVICFYISHHHQGVMARMAQAQSDGQYDPETALSLRAQLSQMEAENDILLAGAAHFCHGRMTCWYLSDKYSSQNDFHISILKSPSINNLLPLHLIR